MFTDFRQMPHAKYGRDECLACHKKLGLGYGSSAKLFGCSKSTIAKIGMTRVTAPRFEGFDDYWQSNRVSWSGRTPKRDASTAVALKVLAQEWMADIRADQKYWKTYDANYSRKYRHLESKRHAQIQAHKTDPENRERANHLGRVNFYRRLGIPEDQIPEKIVRSRPNPHLTLLQKTQNRRESLRNSIRIIWRGWMSEKSAKTILGCSSAEFRSHILRGLKPGWTEADYGTLWNFDHIRPLLAFDVFDPEDVKKANHWTNIRACCCKENALKGPSLPEDPAFSEAELLVVLTMI